METNLDEEIEKTVKMACNKLKIDIEIQNTIIALIDRMSQEQLEKDQKQIVLQDIFSRLTKE